MVNVNIDPENSLVLMETNLPNPICQGLPGSMLIYQREKYISLWIQPCLLRKYDWGMMTRGSAVPSQTVAMDP